MDKLDGNTLKVESKVIVLKKKNKKETKQADVLKVKELSEDIKTKNFDTDNFDNICNGNNPRKIYKIYEYISPDVFDIYVFVGSVDKDIESIIKNRVSSYGYGTRREDQTLEIDKSSLFGSVVHLNARVMHTQTIEECVEAWRSHATLERQAGSDFSKVITNIEDYLLGLGKSSIEIPYSTNIWVSRLK